MAIFRKGKTAGDRAGLLDDATKARPGGWPRENQMSRRRRFLRPKDCGAGVPDSIRNGVRLIERA
jgi:hypothetical protein